MTVDLYFFLRLDCDEVLQEGAKLNFYEGMGGFFRNTESVFSKIKNITLWTSMHSKQLRGIKENGTGCKEIEKEIVNNRNLIAFNPIRFNVPMFIYGLSVGDLRPRLMELQELARCGQHKKTTGYK